VKVSLFNFIFIFLFFIHTFGVQFGGIFINLVSFIIAFFYLVRKGKVNFFFESYFISFIFSCLILLLFVSGFFDFINNKFELGSFFSLIRPVLIWTIMTASFSFWANSTNSILKWHSFIDLLLYVITLVVFIEFFFPTISVFFDFLYGSRSSILSGPLGTSYYIGYLGFFLFVHFIFLYKNSKTLKLFIKLVIACFVVFLSGSKPPLVLLVFILPTLFFHVRYFFISLFSYFFLLFLFFNYYGFGVLSEFLLGLNIETYNISSLIRLLNNAEGAGSFSVRMEQIDFVLEMSFQRFGFGLGLGRGVLLESWISYLGYRYGIFGLLFYFLLWVYLGFKLILLSFNNYSYVNFEFVSLGFWFLSQPILLLSGGMNESGFTGMFSSVVLGYVILLIKKKDDLFV